MTVSELVDHAAGCLEAAGVAFGHGTTNAFDEAAWLVLWQLGLPLDTPMEEADTPVVTPLQHAQVLALLDRRIATRVPAAYLTGEAWLQGVAFHADPRAIVPRSLISELLADGALDYWLSGDPPRVLDLCTGGGSLAILAAMAWPGAAVDAADLSTDALALAWINIQRHGLEHRIHLMQGDGLAPVQGPYDLVLCNPPYVNADSLAGLPPEYLAEPELALAGGVDGMNFVRQLVHTAAQHMAPHAVLVLEIGNERPHFETAFPGIESLWLETSAGDDQVCVLSRAALTAFNNQAGTSSRRQNPNP